MAPPSGANGPNGAVSAHLLLASLHWPCHLVSLGLCWSMLVSVGLSSVRFGRLARQEARLVEARQRGSPYTRSGLPSDNRRGLSVQCFAARIRSEHRYARIGRRYPPIFAHIRRCRKGEIPMRRNAYIVRKQTVSKIRPRADCPG